MEWGSVQPDRCLAPPWPEGRGSPAGRAVFSFHENVQDAPVGRTLRLGPGSHRSPRESRHRRQGSSAAPRLAKRQSVQISPSSAARIRRDCAAELICSIDLPPESTLVIDGPDGSPTGRYELHDKRLVVSAERARVRD